MAALPERAVRGRTASQILTSKDARAFFEGDLGRELGRHKPSTIEVATMSADAVVAELKKMTRHALKKAGLVK